MAALARSPVTAYIGVGANLGWAIDTVVWAIARLGSLQGVQWSRASSLYRSAPVAAQGPDFINAVVVVSTTETAPGLLCQLQAIEVAAGRQRPYRNAPRTLDLDLLLYAEASVWSPQLTLPHPRMGQRAFVLVPLAELAPQRVAASALRAVGDQAVSRIAAPAIKAPDVP